MAIHDCRWGGLSKVLFLECYGGPMNTKEFANMGENPRRSVHNAKKEIEKRMLAQGITPIALFISEVLIEAY